MDPKVLVGSFGNPDTASDIIPAEIAQMVVVANGQRQDFGKPCEMGMNPPRLTLSESRELVGVVSEQTADVLADSRGDSPPEESNVCVVVPPIFPSTFLMGINLETIVGR